MTDYYALLGVGRDASSEDIKRAYRRLARQYHPDFNSGDVHAEERFKEVTKAYSVLSDPEKRQRYDAFGEAGLDGQTAPSDPFGFSTFADVVDAFFGGDPFVTRTRTRSRARRGDDLAMRVHLDFSEAVFGTSKEIRVRTLTPCTDCGGQGTETGTAATTCRACHGTGQQRTVRQSLLGQLVTTSTCMACGGSGHEVLSPCAACKGQGRVGEETELSIDIPPGLDDGVRIRYQGRGNAGQFGGPPGDLYVELDVAPHAVFSRRDDQLVCKLNVPMTVAALGGTLPLVTLDGEETVEIEPGTQTGTVKRFRKRGVPHTDGRGRGDLLVELAVETPDELTDEEQRLLRQLAELRGEAVSPPAASFFARLKGSGR